MGFGNICVVIAATIAACGAMTIMIVMMTNSRRNWFSIIWESQLTADTKVFPFSWGAKSIDMTSPQCPWKLCNLDPDSTSHNAHVLSPLPLKIWKMSEKLSHLHYILPLNTIQQLFLLFLIIFFLSHPLPIIVKHVHMAGSSKGFRPVLVAVVVAWHKIYGLCQFHGSWIPMWARDYNYYYNSKASEWNVLHSWEGLSLLI